MSGAGEGAPVSPVRTELLADGTLLQLTLDRPKGNILDVAMMRALAGGLAAHREDPHLRLVVLRGAGGNFSFGASVDEHVRELAPSMLASFHAFVREVASSPVPIAAMVEGRCLGGAFELALCCHLVLATPDAVFGCPEIRLGVFPPVLAAIGHLRLPGALAERLLLTGEDLDVSSARAAGLVAAVLEGDPDAALLAWYESRLRPLSAFALRQATRIARRSSGLLDALAGPLDDAERQYVDELLESHDGNEGIAAFLGRRRPVWQDR